MSAGTLTLNNNSPSVGGTGTSFTTDLVSGDFIVVVVGGVTYTLPVLEVNSNTRLTLVSNYTGPRLSGAAWQAVPRAAQNQITAELVAQTTAALRGLNYDKQNWQAVFSASGDITVVLPDGSTFTGPSWQNIKDTLALIDIDAVTALANQVRTDAQQVSTDKQAAEAAASSANSDASAAASANSTAQTAKQDAETAAGTANDKAAESKQSAEDAKTAKAAAELAAATVQPENLLQNANNLDDLTDKPAARQNLDVFSREEIADMLSGYLGQVEWQGMRGALEPGTVPRDGQEVLQTGIFADLYAKGVAGKLPTCTEAEWQADPLKRGCYVLNSSTGKMRLPDDNGVQPGSLKIPVKVGDGGVSANDGTMGASALPNVKGSTVGYSLIGGISSDATSNPGGINTSPTNPINIKRGTTNKFGSTDADASWGSCIDLNLNRGSSVYKDGITQIEPNRTQGCWTVRYATKATNGGSIDALALATAITAGDAALSARIVAMNARVDYALIDFGTMVLSQRKVIDNPFGNSQPVEVVAEVQRTDSTGVLRWADPCWIFNSSTGSYGVHAGYLEGVGIVVQCGNMEMSNTSINTGMPIHATSNAVTNLPVRVHVRKIKQ